MTINKQKGGLSARRFALVATTVLGLSAGGYFVAPGITFNTPAALAQNLSQEAKVIPAPIGFADIVETVKPAVGAGSVMRSGWRSAAPSNSDRRAKASRPSASTRQLPTTCSTGASARPSRMVQATRMPGVPSPVMTR